MYWFNVGKEKLKMSLKRLFGGVSDLEKILDIAVHDKDLYKLALSHRSCELPDNNERLEFLGDAVLQSVVSDYLYKKFGSHSEGDLTILRSKVVSRKSLNKLGAELGLPDLIKQLLNEDRIKKNLSVRVYGDTLEALIGAVYLDRGYFWVRYFILNTILRELLDLQKLDKRESNFKGRLVEWSQQEQVKLDFVQLAESKRNGRDYFVMGIKLNDELLAEGEGYNKRSAEHEASRKALKLVEKT